MPELLEEIRGDNLCVSLLFDRKCRHWDADKQDLNQHSGHSIPADADLKTTMSAFKDSMNIGEAKAREIEQSTRQQRLSLLSTLVFCSLLQNYSFKVWTGFVFEEGNNTRQFSHGDSTTQAVFNCSHKVWHQ